MEREVHIPDGGWGWVIVTCSFLIHMFDVGTLYAISVLYVAWLDHFGDGKGLTSWIIYMSMAVMSGIGPVPGALSRRWGNRAVVIGGGLVMCLGFVASYFAMNVYFLIVSIGIVVGTGAGCVYLPSVSLVAMYFTSKRSLAMGIAASGLGAGAFFMAPFLNWLEYYYGWRGCMLILAGISLNMCVLGALMRPLETAPKCGSCRPKKDGDLVSVNFSLLSRRSFAAGDCNTPEVCAEEFQENCEDTCLDNHSGNYMGPCKRPSAHLYSPLPASEMETDVAPVAYFPAHPAVVHQQDNNTVRVPERTSKLSTNQDAQDKSMKSKHKVFAETVSKDGDSVKLISDSVKAHNKFLDINVENDRKVGGSMEILPSAKIAFIAPVDKQYSSHVDLRGRASVLHLSVPAQETSLSDMQIMMAGSLSSILYMHKTWPDNSVFTVFNENSEMTSSNQADLMSAASAKECSATGEKITMPDDEKETYFSKLLASLRVYVSLLRNGTFLIFIISNFLTNLSFFMPVLYMADRALHYGIDRTEAAMLVSLYGAGNIFGKLFCGWLADRKLVDRLFYYIAALTACGAATALSALCGSSHELHSIYAFVFGCFIGAYVTLWPIVTVDLIGLSSVSEAYGLLLFLVGVATACGTPMAGWIFDWTGSYDISYILHGMFLVLSAVMLIPMLVWKQRLKAK